MKPATAAQCGPFLPDPDIPADHNGLQACATCHLLGEPGDAHHDMPAVPEQDEHRRRYGDSD